MQAIFANYFFITVHAIVASSLSREGSKFVSSPSQSSSELTVSKELQCRWFPLPHCPAGPLAALNDPMTLLVDLFSHLLVRLLLLLPLVLLVLIAPRLLEVVLRLLQYHPLPQRQRGEC